MGENKILFDDILKNVDNVAKSIISKKESMINFNSYLNTELKQIKNKIDEVKKKVKNLIQTSKSITTTINKNESRIIYKNEECKELNEQVVLLTRQRDELIKEIEISKSDKNKNAENLEKDIVTLLAKKNNLTEKKEELLGELENAPVSDVSEKYNVIEPYDKEQIDNLKRKLYDTENQIQNLNKTIDSYKRPENRELINKVEILTKQIQDVKTENERNKREILKLEEENKGLNDLLSKAKTQIENITNQLSTFDLEQTEIMKNKGNIENYIRQINESIDEINRDIDNPSTISGGKKHKTLKNKPRKTSKTSKRKQKNKKAKKNKTSKKNQKNKKSKK
jgi:chromosome segregation ATPase